MKRRVSSPEEQKFLADYRPKDWPRASVAVDLVVLTIIDAELKVLMLQRNEHPFKGEWALPGGFVHVFEAKDEQGEDVDDAASRRLREETGLDPKRVYLEQLYTFGKSGRDPRMRVVSVAYYALVRPDLAPIVKAGDGSSAADWKSVNALSSLAVAFDHAEIIATALNRIRGKLEYSNIAFDLVPSTFTIPELRHAYSIVLNKQMDPGNFRRRFNGLLSGGVIEKAPGKRITASKPAAVFRFKR